jgi:hypothetical protein
VIHALRDLVRSPTLVRIARVPSITEDTDVRMDDSLTLSFENIVVSSSIESTKPRHTRGECLSLDSQAATFSAFASECALIDATIVKCLKSPSSDIDDSMCFSSHPVDRLFQQVLTQLQSRFIVSRRRFDERIRRLVQHEILGFTDTDYVHLMTSLPHNSSSGSKRQNSASPTLTRQRSSVEETQSELGFFLQQPDSEHFVGLTDCQYTFVSRSSLLEDTIRLASFVATKAHVSEAKALSLLSHGSSKWNPSLVFFSRLFFMSIIFCGSNFLP